MFDERYELTMDKNKQRVRSLLSVSLVAYMDGVKLFMFNLVGPHQRSARVGTNVQY